MTAHFETADLIDYHRGLLSQEETETLLGHCNGCRTCSDRLAMVIALREVAARRRLFKRSALLTSSIATVIVAAFALATYAPSAFVTGDAVPVTAHTRPPGLLFQYATTELPHRSFLVLRFREGMPVAHGDDRQLRVEDAVVDLWAGRTAPAIPALRALWTEAPSEEIAAYLGIGLYLTQRTDDEVEAFLEVGTRTGWSTLSRYSTFYLANHYLRTGRNAAAYALLRVVAADSDAPGSAARRLLEKLPDETDLSDQGLGH